MGAIPAKKTMAGSREPAGERQRPVPAMFLAPLIALFAAAGCIVPEPREDPTRHYLLTPGLPPAAEAAPAASLRIAVGPAELPDYLERPAIVVWTGANRLFVADFHRWAEPLSRGIARVLRENLHSLGFAASASSSVAERSDAEVRIAILACEGVRKEGGGGIRFAAEWALWSAGGGELLASGRFVAPEAAWDGEDFGALAGALSGAIARLSEEVAAALAGVGVGGAHPQG